MEKFSSSSITIKPDNFIPDKYFEDYDYYEIYNDAIVYDDKVYIDGKEYHLHLITFANDDTKWVVSELLIPEERLKILQKYCQCQCCQPSLITKIWRLFFKDHNCSVCDGCLKTNKYVPNQYVLRKTMDFCDFVGITY